MGLVFLYRAEFCHAIEWSTSQRNKFLRLMPEFSIQQIYSRTSLLKPLESKNYEENCEKLEIYNDYGRLILLYKKNWVQFFFTELNTVVSCEDHISKKQEFLHIDF